jgi:catalase (peroxidase I)
VKWAERIRSPKSLADKLGVKAGMQVAVLGVEDEAVLRDLDTRGATVVAGKVPLGTALVLWRVTQPSQLAKLTSIVKKIARNGAIWAVHPRGDVSVADTVIFAAAKDAGLTYTKVVRFSDTDTAEKLVIPVAAR